MNKPLLSVGMRVKTVEGPYNREGWVNKLPLGTIGVIDSFACFGHREVRDIDTAKIQLSDGTLALVELSNIIPA